MSISPQKDNFIVNNNFKKKDFWFSLGLGTEIGLLFFFVIRFVNPNFKIDAVGKTEFGGLVLLKCMAGYSDQSIAVEETLYLPPWFKKDENAKCHLVHLLAEVGVVEHELGIPVSDAYLVYCGEEKARWIRLPDEWKEKSLSLLIDLRTHVPEKKKTVPEKRGGEVFLVEEDEDTMIYF
jgi:hypothetical protein